MPARSLVLSLLVLPGCLTVDTFGGLYNFDTLTVTVDGAEPAVATDAGFLALYTDDDTEVTSYAWVRRYDPATGEFYVQLDPPVFSGVYYDYEYGSPDDGHAPVELLFEGVAVQFLVEEDDDGGYSLVHEDFDIGFGPISVEIALGK